MEIPAYNYKHTNLITGEYYFGTRCGNIRLGKFPEEDFPIYITSGTIKKDIQQNPENWKCEIIELFFGENKKEKAFWTEQERIKNNWGDSLLLNKNYYDKEKGHKIFSLFSNSLKGKIYSEIEKNILYESRRKPRKKGKRGPQKNKYKNMSKVIKNQQNKLINERKHVLLKENRIFVNCKYCNKKMDTGNLARWHGEKCKMKIEVA